MGPLPGIDDAEARLERARWALEGLALGDAFGGRFFLPPGPARDLPPAPWRYSDDTAMALAVVEVLERRGGVDRDELAAAFARRYRDDPDRGYGQSVRRVLERIGSGTPWAEAAGAVFGGAGSMGNGGAMRAAPVGAYFAADLGRVAAEARASAEVTHAHAEGQAGAIAVAVAAAWAARRPAGPGVGSGGPAGVGVGAHAGGSDAGRPGAGIGPGVRGVAGRGGGGAGQREPDHGGGHGAAGAVGGVAARGGLRRGVVGDGRGRRGQRHQRGACPRSGWPAGSPWDCKR